MARRPALPRFKDVTRSCTLCRLNGFLDLLLSGLFRLRVYKGFAGPVLMMFVED